jgi:hypothetical protein
MFNKDSLLKRNQKIIDIVMKQIEETCPDAIDMIGIGGSFCNGDIYEKSDLDLVIVANDIDKARSICKCFILGDVAFDIYVTDWSRFSSMSEYKGPYVTKLFDLDIVYTRDDSIKDRYLELRDICKKNMNNDELVNNSVRLQAAMLSHNYRLLEETGDMGVALRLLNRIITNVEYIIYMINRSYVKRGIKRIPEEIRSMNKLPLHFLDTYNIICNCDSLTYVKAGASSFMMDIDELLSEYGIEIEEEYVEEIEDTKLDLTADNIRGTYEEIYSNWKNKMHHAIDINSNYLSFRTMAACQEFYDEMAMLLDIPRIELLSKYNPTDLVWNEVVFNDAMEEWKKLYSHVGLEVEQYNSLEELDNLYKIRGLKY